MSNEVYCDNCGSAIDGDGPNIYDEACYRELENEIEKLRSDNNELQEEIDELQNLIDDSE